jgi:hypothetical protein
VDSRDGLDNIMKRKFLTLLGLELQPLSVPASSYTAYVIARERVPGTHWIGGWVDPRAGLDDVKNRIFLPIPGLELQPLSCLAHSQSLHGLSYPGYFYHGTYL